VIGRGDAMDRRENDSERAAALSSPEMRTLRHDVEQMQVELERASQLAGLKNDPTSPLVRALSLSLGLQARLNEQAEANYRSASDRLDRQLEDTLVMGEQGLKARRTTILENLVPELMRLTTRSLKTWRRSVTLKTALSFGGVAVALALSVGLAGYGAGWAAGRQVDMRMTNALVAAAQEEGPAAETVLVSMVQNNDLSAAWATCESTVFMTQSGRRACQMPMWLDAAPLPSPKN
jgi:hypothetical protein